ncbi:MAG: DUF1385 domain-containing protein [Bacteriovorax sp.]|nr:DUF1385 domain-containing protein [Bacteriovorax sp.]
MKTNMMKKIILLVSKQYASIGGQAVIEGVMMRSPNAFVVAVRKPDGSIRLRRDQWYGLSNKLAFLKKPFLRGVLVLIETMANGVVSLNYSANIAMDEENKKEALKKGLSESEYETQKKSKEKVGIETFLSIAFSFAFGIGLFVFLPHALTAVIEKFSGAKWDLQSWQFHAIDGTIKACIFLSYIYLISFIPDIKKVFQYHGAEHKSISTFEAGEELTIENAKKYPTFHPRCGTTFIFFLMFVSIILFAIIFAIIPVGTNSPVILKHLYAMLFKVSLTLPIAGISYELIKFVGKDPHSTLGRIMSYPGKLLQRLTTKEPTEEQLEVALASIKTVLFLEEKYNLKTANEKKITVDEIDFMSLSDIENSNFKLKDFLEG